MKNGTPFMKKEEIIKLIKYVAGSVAAVLLSVAVGLQFAYAAGIITLLTIQDTKRETVRIAIKRVVIFFYNDGSLGSDISACGVSCVGVRNCADSVSYILYCTGYEGGYSSGSGVVHPLYFSGKLFMADDT